MSTFAVERRDLVARSLLLALARREEAGRAQPRLLDRRAWDQFKGNLDQQHLLALLAEDAAVRFPLPADLRLVLDADSAHAATDLARIPGVTVYEWLRALTPDLLQASGPDTLAHYARTLGLPHRFAGAELHKIQADKRVLELPGTGGQLVARALERSPDAFLHTNTTVLTSSWADRAMAGLVAMELDAPDVDFARPDPDLSWATHPAQRNRFDLVFGLRAERDGGWSREDLVTRFPAATIVLV